MSLRALFRNRPARIVLVVLLCLFANAALAQLVQISGATPVGSDGPPTTVLLTLPHGGTIDNVKVLTGGSAGFDFKDLGTGSCATSVAYLAGQQCTVQVSYHPTAPGERRGAVALLDRNGKTLSSRSLVASATGPLGTFVPGTMSTVAGDQAWIYAGDGNAAAGSSIFLPFGLAVNKNGDLYIADSANNRIRRVDGVTQLISTIAGTGVIGSTGDGGPALQATLSNPVSIALDAAGDLYFTDSGNNVVRRIDAFTSIISTVAGTMGSHGYTGDLGTATSATLNNPNGITLDAAGNLYITDTGNHAVRRVDATTGIISSIAGRGIASFSGDGGPAVSAGLNSPWSVTHTPAGELYIADQGNQRVRKIDVNGTISTIMGTGTAGGAGDDGAATAAQLNVPSSVAVDLAGNIYIADSGNNRVRKILRSNGQVITIAGNFGETFEGDDGPADLAGLYGPYTLAFNDGGDLFIADVFHNRVRKVSANAATLLYPPMRVNRVSAPLPQTFENDGNALLNPSALRNTLESQLDPTLTTCAVGTALAPLDQCVLSVSFAPSVTGEQVKGVFNLDSDAANSSAALTVAGKVLDVDPTTTTVTSSSNPSTTGTVVTFSVAVTTSGIAPTGQITLFDGANAIMTAQLGPGGLGSFSLSSLTGGQHNISVSYAGDASNSTSLSVTLLQIVRDMQAATSTSLTSTSNPVVAGAPVTFSAAVTVVTPGSGNGTIGGTVVFKEGVNQLGTGTISNGVATLTSSSLTVGNHSIVAIYNGSSTYASSTSTSLSQAVQLASTRTVLTSAANPSVSGAPLILTANVSGNGGIPGGQVVFFDGPRNLGSATLNAQGFGTLNVLAANWTPGSHSLSASYAGDPADGPSVSQTLVQTVNLAQTQVLLAASVNPAALGAAVTFTATVTGNGGIPGGAVQFLDGAAALGAGTLDATGNASLSTDKLTLGVHHLTVVYAGDSLDAGSTSVALAEQVQAATIGIGMGSSVNPAIFGSPVVFSAQVSGTGSKPIGSVTFTEGSNPLGSGTLDATGTASISISSLAIGPHTVVANYSGDVNHATAASSAYNQQIVQATSTTVTVSAASTVAGLPVTVTATTVGAGGQPFQGEVLLYDGPTIVARLTPVNGLVSWTSNQLTVGQHHFVASYSGDTLDAPSTSTAAVTSVTQATTQTTLTSSANPAFAGDSVRFSITVNGTGATPQGNVALLDAGQPIANLTLVNGAAQATLTSLAPGLHQLKAAYAGDAFDGPSQSPAVTQQIAQKTSVSLVSIANPSLLSDSVTLTVSVSNGVPTAAPTGTVTLSDGGTIVGSGALAGGSISFTLNAPVVGSHTLIASYAGDAANTPATSAALVQVVNLRPTAASLTASTTNLSAGQPVVLTSVVQGNGSRRPTGSVSFQSGSTVLGTATIDANGIATLSATPPELVYTMVAAYSGDALFAPSVSPAVKIVVGPTIEFTLALTPANLTMQTGQHGSLSIFLTTAKTFDDMLEFGCAGLPASATCTFSEPQVHAGGGVPHTLTVTVDTGAPLGAGATAKLDGAASGSANLYLCGIPGAVLLGLLLRRKRRPLGLLLALAALAIVPMLGGCGTSFTLHDTVPGDYTFQIVGTGSTTHATQTAPVQLKVTQ